MNKRWIIGLTSGSTLQGVDAALVEGGGVGMELRPRLIHFHRQSFPRDLRDLIQRLGSNQPQAIRQVGLAHRLLGESYALAARVVADQAKISLAQIQCLGCPGHTIWHEPEGRFPATLALGMTEVIAERTGLTTFSDFRSRDVAAGGQGGPLTPVMDYLLFHQTGEHRVLIHLGGTTAILSLPGELGMRNLIGFQAGPCNILLDKLIQRMTGGRESFDAGGKHAVQGCCIDALLDRWLAHPLLQRRPPKTLPRHEFGDEFISQTLHQAKQNRWSLHDLLCTATHFIARSIQQSLQRFVPGPIHRLLLSGGGVRNGLLWSLLEQNLAPVPLERLDQHGLPIEARDAVAFAGLAALTLDGIGTNLPSTTGASGSRLLGNITPGSPANWARCVSWMACQNSPLALAAA